MDWRGLNRPSSYKFNSLYSNTIRLLLFKSGGSTTYSAGWGRWNPEMEWNIFAFSTSQWKAMCRKVPFFLNCDPVRPLLVNCGPLRPPAAWAQISSPFESERSQRLMDEGGRPCNPLRSGSNRQPLERNVRHGVTCCCFHLNWLVFASWQSRYSSRKASFCPLESNDSFLSWPSVKIVRKLFAGRAAPSRTVGAGRQAPPALAPLVIRRSAWDAAYIKTISLAT